MNNTTPLTLTLRDAAPGDALCVAMLGLQVFLDTYATQGIRKAIALEAYEAFSPQSIAELIGQPETFILLAESQGHLLGFAQVALRVGHAMIDTHDAAELQRLYVQERFTGHGIGHQLLVAAEQCAAGHGASSLWATVWTGNQRALGFYPRQGYALIGSPLYVLQDETHENHLFAKSLSYGDHNDAALQ